MLATSHSPSAQTDRLSLARYVRERYWPVLRPGLAPSSVPREWPILDQFADRLGLLRLDQLRAEHVEGWWAALRARVRPATCNRHLVRVGHCLRTGVRWGLLAKDPSAGIRKLKPPKGRVRWLSDEQRARVIAQADPDLRLYILAGRYTAGRRANLHELRRRDLDLVGMTVTFAQTKNGDSQTVPLHPGRVPCVTLNAPSTGPLVDAPRRPAFWHLAPLPTSRPGATHAGRSPSTRASESRDSKR
jgi:hypothetical protein